MCEGIAAQLDPEFEMITAITPYLPRLVAPEAE
jgi:predicted unusual protein kinase regulating ubiquinone biosynthesis (AarF/ABC1/UbiB family)